MGEVYKARDTRLNRIVAVKVLPTLLADKPELKDRFKREAETIASLNHPHICTLYDIGNQDGTDFLVMEYLEGETLATRLLKGPLPLDQVLRYAIEIAEALDKAHRKGVTHRDIKPGNIMLAKNGSMLLDFGLAKLRQTAVPASTHLSQLPTLSHNPTIEGTILGTPQYMAPEQVEGKTDEIDARTDIFAFGAVMYEMATGKKAFEGKTNASLMGAILHLEPPPMSSLQAMTPPALDRVVQKCLAKEPDERWQTASDLCGELKWIDEASAIGPVLASSASVVVRHPSREYLDWTVAAFLLLILGAAIPFLRRMAEVPACLPVARTTILLPNDQELVSSGGTYPLAVSRDGDRLAYVAEQEGHTQLYVRELSALEPRVIPGSGGAAHPFFSPDGQWVGFFAGGALQKAAVAGGASLRICNVPSVTAGAAWAPDNTIVLALRGSGLFIVNATGGTLQPLAGSSPAAWPEILPDGRTVLFTTGGLGDEDGYSAIATMPLRGGARRIVARMTDSPLEGPAALGVGGVIGQAQFVSNGYLVYGQSPGIVRALPFDLASLDPKGSPVSLVDSVERARDSGGVYFAASPSGLLVYASTGDRHQLLWVDRDGVETPISNDREAFRTPRLSPDGKRIAVAINDETRRSDIWIYGWERGTKIRLTTAGHNLTPVWSPDGARITFAGRGGIVELPVDGSGTQETLLSSQGMRGRLAVGSDGYPTSWSPDGQDLLFNASELDLWVLPHGPHSVPRPLLVRSSNDYDGQFSPDGRWVAYTSDESGQNEVYVARYPGFANKLAISTDGGLYPRWSRDQREVFYRQGDALMAVTVETKQVFRAEKPRRLFAGQFSGAGRDSSFDVAPDGKRFVMVKSDQASTLRQLTVVQNWFEGMKRLAPTKVTDEGK
jgi:Tol biopolymer transport system component/predicted Ser/Thr protein kinase